MFRHSLISSLVLALTAATVELLLRQTFLDGHEGFMGLLDEDVCVGGTFPPPNLLGHLRRAWRAWYSCCHHETMNHDLKITKVRGE